MIHVAGQMLEVLAEGVLYANPKPYLRSLQAYFPSAVELENGELLAAFAVGEAFESVNMKTHLARSRDGGETWELEQAMTLDVPGRLTSNTARISHGDRGELLLVVRRDDRTDHPDMGLVNPENLGFVPGEMLLLRSRDDGRNWSEPAVISPPFPVTSLELCTPITALGDGRWILPCSPWRSWNGELRGKDRMCALVSHDQGKTWPDAWSVMEDGHHVFWESRIVQSPGGALLATAWTHDLKRSRDLENHFALSTDGGKNWTPPAPTGIKGQTLEPIFLEDGTVLSVYRRVDEPGLWALHSRFEDGNWRNGETQPLWGAASLMGRAADGKSSREMFSDLRFGAPNMIALQDGTIFLSFWCQEGTQSIIRWMRLGGLSPYQRCS